MLAVDVEKKLGTFEVNAAFQGDSGVTALFGPSGSGKTSIVAMIAGLSRPDRGRIAVGGEVLFDSAQDVDMPPHRRGVGYVFQDGRLFPHLSVARNLDYGRWMSGKARDEAQVKHVTELLDIGHLLKRRPGALSGGERQRVALGRALLMQPRLMLLDEPLASLDAARKSEILPYFQRLRDETKLPMIYVSHDPNEVKALASRVVLLDDGRVKAAGGIELL
ncbi:MAG TPA: molybdenum ABC transporter ATP-binding protein [Pseudolabrys sp.]|nr:molybdenum ABC transporter ATP-binding protein [Pseudolabrys sp.]